MTEIEYCPGGVPLPPPPPPAEPPHAAKPSPIPTRMMDANERATRRLREANAAGAMRSKSHAGDATRGGAVTTEPAIACAEAAVVVTVSVMLLAEVPPLRTTGCGEKEHAVPVGSPSQASVSDPE